MKKIVSLLIVLLFAANVHGQQYLSDLMKPADSYKYFPFKSTGNPIWMGGIDFKGGFVLQHSVGPYRPGYAMFNLGGKYESLQFVMGCTRCWLDDKTDYLYGVGKKAGIVVIYADGKKVFDEVIREEDVPHTFKLNVSGVNELKFALLQGELMVGFAETTLWTKGKAPKNTGKMVLPAPKTKELVKDLRSYYFNPYMKVVCSPESPNRQDGDLKELKINGVTYKYGLEINAPEGMTDNNYSWAYFNLGGQYKTLTFKVGPRDDSRRADGRGWVTVRADDKIVFEKEFSTSSLAEDVTIDIDHCQRLSFEGENSYRTVYLGVVEMKVYPEGVQPQAKQSVQSKFPDVCKLISNIPPYAVGGGLDGKDMVYDGSSTHRTFSMGGQKFYEGLLMYSSANFLYGNAGAFASFDLGGEFDYLTFTAGFVSKNGVMKNDTLRIFADDKLVFEKMLSPLAANQRYTVPLKRCRQLKFVLVGFDGMFRPAFGVADAVVYRNKVTENDLFVHEHPACPPQVNLIDFGVPYVHHVPKMKDEMDKAFYDGSTMKRYFEMPDGGRVNKGFLLQTSVHFSMDVNGVAGAAVLGVPFTGYALNLLALAAGDEVCESSVAAFNAYNEYDEMTFTVACLRPVNANYPSEVKENLYVGGDGEVKGKFAISETMKPATFTVPLDKCGQIMFFLECGNDSSGTYVFYDVHLKKK